MKKIRSAAAVLASVVAVPALAQDVTLYGLVDAGVVGTRTQGAGTVAGIDSGITGGSRWGVRGAEDLGGGLQASFRLENGFESDTGAAGQGGRLFGRQAWVGLSGRFGEARLGRQESLGYAWFAEVGNPFGNAYLQARTASLFGTAAISERVDNSAFYFTPRVAGVQAAAGYSANASGAEGQRATAAGTAGRRLDSRVALAGVRYAGGPVSLALVHEQRRASDALRNDATPGNAETIKNTLLGAAYDFGAFTLHAGYGLLQGRDFLAGARDEKTALLGASVPWGAHRVLASYQQARGRNANLGRIDATVRGVAVGYEYSFSKRTRLVALATQLDDVAERAGSATGTADRRELALGLRHAF
ncbi:MAG: porin [Xylophilus ampelinus]